jgi:radical SAM protein with 4Fe4S-binding SPASM domain
MRGASPRMKVFKKIIKVFWLIYKRPKGFNDYCLGLISAIIRSKKVLGFPVHITIEPINQCNLHCPICETGSGMLKRSKGRMSFNNFKLIIDKIKVHTNSIFFYYMGEPFLNDDAYKMIRYAKDNGLYVTSCTNGHFIDTVKLIDSGIDEISFQIGGVRQESHENYRVGSDLGGIIKNIEQLVKQRGISNKFYPKIILGLIVMKQNESEIEKFYELAGTLGVDEARLLQPCVRTWEQGRQFLPKDEKFWDYDREAFDKGILRPRKNLENRCNWIYISTVILNNGDIVPCCRDVEGNFTMGNIFKDDLKTIWNGEKYRGFRKMIAFNKSDVSICKSCSGFKTPGLYESRKIK